MEFREKLQTLRAERGLTQEELAAALYVSRTAVSKWESGRGYPSIDSLKGIAAYFEVSVDSLLSGEELLTVAEEDSREQVAHTRDVVFGLLDCSVALCLFLPFFAERSEGAVREVSLLALAHGGGVLPTVCLVPVLALIVAGVLTLAMQNCRQAAWIAVKSKLSVGLSAAIAVLFVVSLQPYAATFLLVLLAIKVLMLVKWP